MPTYRAAVHYYFKKGMEEEGLRFLENELVRKAQDLGCHNIEVIYNERDPAHVVGAAVWNSVEEARKFQASWEAKEKELARMCTKTPERHFYRIRSSYSEKMRKAA